MKFTARELNVMGKLAKKYISNPDKPIEIEYIENMLPMIRGKARRNKTTVRNSTAHFMRVLCLKFAAAGIGFERTTKVGRSNNAEYSFSGKAEANKAVKLSEAGPAVKEKPAKVAKPKKVKVAPKPKVAKVAKPKKAKAEKPAAEPAKREVARGSVIKRARKPKVTKVEPVQTDLEDFVTAPAQEPTEVQPDFM